MKKTDLQLKELNQRLEKFKRLRVLIVGDVGIDRYTHGVVERISPEAPVPIVRVVDEKLKLGLASNVAENIATFGAQVDLVGLIGVDRFSQDFYKLLRTKGISSAGLVEDEMRKTIVKERVVSERQQLLRIDYETTGTISAAVEKAIFKKVEKYLKEADIIIIQDYAKGMLTPPLMEKMMEAARKHKVVIAVDPNAKSVAELYRGCTFLTPNLKEAEALTGVKITDDLSLQTAGRKLLEKTNASQVVITRGKDGMAIFEKGSREIKLIPTYAREVYDVSGAGDTVIGLMSLAVSSGMKIEDAAVLGNLGAGVVVGKRGTATVNGDELREALAITQKYGRVTVLK
jgi:rfaE bifunctional protein kinase chain/domain